MTRRFAVAALAVGVLAMLSGCSGFQSVSIKDRNAPGGAVRATFRGMKGDPPRRMGAGIEVGYEGYRAEGTQSLSTGQRVEFPGVTFTGPQDLKHDVQLSQLYLAYNHRFGIGQHVELEPYVGAMRVWAKVTTTPQAGAGVRVIDEEQWGVTAGFTPRWRFNERVAAEVRYNVMDTHLRIGGTSYEAAAVLNPADHVALRLGWVVRKHKIGDFGDFYSRVNVRSRGPIATLQFDF